jgi:hypothetical protein
MDPLLEHPRVHRGRGRQARGCGGTRLHQPDLVGLWAHRVGSKGLQRAPKGCPCASTNVPLRSVASAWLQRDHHAALNMLALGTHKQAQTSTNKHEQERTWGRAGSLRRQRGPVGQWASGPVGRASPEASHAFRRGECQSGARRPSAVRRGGTCAWRCCHRDDHDGGGGTAGGVRWCGYPGGAGCLGWRPPLDP